MFSVAGDRSGRVAGGINACEAIKSEQHTAEDAFNNS
jgi:hypothetical protein